MIIKQFYSYLMNEQAKGTITELERVVALAYRMAIDNKLMKNNYYIIYSEGRAILDKWDLYLEMDGNFLKMDISHFLCRLLNALTRLKKVEKENLIASVLEQQIEKTFTELLK